MRLVRFGVTLVLAGVLVGLLVRPASGRAPGPGKRALPRPDPSGTPPDRLVDVNAATEEELLALPGIGRVRAQAILDGRPYGSIDELLDRRVVPAHVYSGIRELIVARGA